MAKKPADTTKLKTDAMQAMGAGRLPEAGRLLQQALKARPDDAQALGLLGVVQAQGGQVTQAERSMSRAAALAPRDAGLRFNLGCLRRGMNVPAAIGDFEAAAALDPRHLGAWMNLGDLQLQAGNAAAARLAYGRAVALAPDMPEARFGLALAAQAGNAFEEAEAELRRVLRLAQGFAQAWIELGRVRLALHRPRDAEAALRGALRFAGGNAAVTGLAHQLLAGVAATPGGW